MVTIARDSVVAMAFLFTLLARTCLGFLQFPFGLDVLTVNSPWL